MANPLTRAFSALRDMFNGRRRMAGYTHPEAHRAGGRNPDAALPATSTRTPIPPMGGGGLG